MNALALILLLPFLAQESETDRLKKDIEKMRTDYALLLRQSELQLAKIQDLSDQLAKARNDKSLSQAEQHYAQQQAQRMAEDLRDLEEKQVAAARQKKILEDKAATPKTPSPVVAAPTAILSRSLAAKVTATANEIGLVVLSIGSQLGIAEGDEFTLTRKGEFVAKVRIDRVDAQWCAGKVVQKTVDPAVGDDAVRKDPRNAQAAPGLKRPAADEVQALRKELDEVRAQVRQLTDRLVPSFQGPGVSVEEASEALCEHLGIARGLVVRQVREGSAAERAGLKPHDVIPDRSEARLIEALESGSAIEIIRRGAKVRVQGR